MLIGSFEKRVIPVTAIQYGGKSAENEQSSKKMGMDELIFQDIPEKICKFDDHRLSNEPEQFAL